MAARDVAVAALSGLGGVVIATARDLVRDGLQARRDHRARDQAAEAARLDRIEAGLTNIRDDVASLSGIVSGLGVLERRRPMEPR